MKKLRNYKSFIVIAIIMNAFSIGDGNLFSDQTTTDTIETSNHLITDWEARLEKARVLSYLHRYDESIKDYERLLKEKPDSLVIRQELAKILYYQGKSKEALDILNEIPVNQLNEKIRLFIADILTSLKEYSKAKEIYQDYIKLNPQDNQIKLKLAEILSWGKQYDESVKLYQQLLIDKPDDIQLRRKYAKVLIWMGNPEQAEEELRKTLHESEQPKVYETD